MGRGETQLTATRDEVGGRSGDLPPGGETESRSLDARIAAAAALRELGHAVVAHEVDDDLFARITSDVRALLSLVEAAPDRHRSPHDMTHAVFVVPPRQGTGRANFPDCIVTGKANPMGMAAEVVRDGEDALMRTTIGPAFEGAPGRAHGGAVAALFDEVMGFVLSIHATPAYTGRLSVSYRAATPLGVELELRARLRSRHGRKLRIDAEARHGKALIAEAEGLFVAVDPARFASG
jgi:acyl-coenzyme A thioesterase PaaI-like protein